MFRLYWEKFVVPYWQLTITAVVCFIIASAAGLAAPIIIKFIIDVALDAENITYLNYIVFGIAGLYAIKALFFYIYSYNISKAGNIMISRKREDMFAKLQSLDYGYFINTSTGDIVSYFTNDLLLVQQAVSFGIPDLVVESLTLLATIAIMLYFDWQLALVTFITLPFIVLAISFFNKKIAGFGKLLEHTLSKVTNIIHQSLLSVMMVQSYGREDYEYQKFSVKIQEAAGDFLRIQRLNAVLFPLVEFLGAIGLTIIIWFGGREVVNGDLTIGGMVAFLVYIINIPMPIRKITEAISRLKLGMVAWERLKELDRQAPQIVDGELELPEAKGMVEFKNVSFQYQTSSTVLKNINLIANPGEVIAIVGPSGAGKSSFANLLLRFYDPSEGLVLLDGIDIRRFKIAALRSHIGFIQQEPILFNASILENIRYGCPAASYSVVERAAKLANAHEFIMELPQGYHSSTGELGGLLSGGQRQRIAIARAIIMEPSILLLDEPTAALDAHSERQVMAAIRNAGQGRTTLIITHRLSTLMASDKVFYLSGGQVLETGTHAELLSRNGLYARAVERGELSIRPNC